MKKIFILILAFIIFGMNAMEESPVTQNYLEVEREIVEPSSPQVSYKKVLTESMIYPIVSELIINNTSGNIRVTGVDEDVFEINVTKKLFSIEEPSIRSIFNDDRLLFETIDTSFDKNKTEDKNNWISYEVKVPKKTTVYAYTRQGTMKATNVNYSELF